MQFGTGPGDDERQAKEDTAYWERQGFDRLGKFIIFRLMPAMFLGLAIAVWYVVERGPKCVEF